MEIIFFSTLIPLPRVHVGVLVASCGIFILLMALFSPTHKRTEGRAPVGGFEFTSKRRRTTGGGSSRNRCSLNVKMCDLRDR
jgi:hypothetical protein